jgi:hypothetical protein
MVQVDEVGVVVDAEPGCFAFAIQVSLFNAPVRLDPLLEALLAWLATVASREEYVHFYLGPLGQWLCSNIRIDGSPVKSSMSQVIQPALKEVGDVFVVEGVKDLPALAPPADKVQVAQCA